MSDTLAAAARFELEVKKSRFLVNAGPANSPQAARDWLERSALRDATHNCWAYRIGQQYRFCDDGEPSGTAGRPILAAIDGQGFDHVIAVVTRWYGGIKLGAGGLVRAYGGAAAECLRRAPRQPIVEQVDASLHCEFAHSGAVHALLASFDALRVEERFEADGLHFILRLPRSAFGGFQRAVSDATRGQATIAVIPSHAP